MADHIETGQLGEELAVKWLIEKGYILIHRNWRHKHWEIDIVARKDKYLHFIEVKARHYTPFDYPESNVTKKKFKNMQRAADEYLFQNPGSPWIQYNILSVTIYNDGKEPEVFFIEDVFL